jgi:hypothetical protein
VTGPHQAPGRPERVDGSPIERYLDELLGRLRVDPARARRILAEAEDHLYATAEGLQGDGLSRSDAEQEAVRRFGEPAEVAASHRRIRLQDLPRPMIGLSGIGLVAIGVSGLFAEVMGRLWGAAFVAGDPPGSTYTPARCADFQEYLPGHDCLSAAALHHWGRSSSTASLLASSDCCCCSPIDSCPGVVGYPVVRWLPWAPSSSSLPLLPSHSTASTWQSKAGMAWARLSAPQRWPAWSGS